MHRFSIRRRALLGSALLSPALFLPSWARAAESDDEIDRRIAALEKQIGGSIGVSVIDTQTYISFGYRETESFPLCSTF